MEEQIGGSFFALTERHGDLKVSGFVRPLNGVQFGGPLCSQTEKDGKMKPSGFVDLIEVDVMGYAKNRSDPSKGPLLKPELGYKLGDYFVP